MNQFNTVPAFYPSAEGATNSPHSPLERGAHRAGCGGAAEGGEVVFLDSCHERPPRQASPATPPQEGNFRPCSGKVYLGLDYFDATINRVAAWIIGMRALGKALITALLEPSHLLREAEERDDKTMRLALFDEFNNLPVNAVWDYLCETTGAGGREWMDALKAYERDVQAKR